MKQKLVTANKNWRLVNNRLQKKLDIRYFHALQIELKIVKKHKLSCQFIYANANNQNTVDVNFTQDKLIKMKIWKNLLIYPE